MRRSAGETAASWQRSSPSAPLRAPARAGSAARRRCRPCGRWSPRRRPPNRTCDFHRIRLSMSTSSGCPLVQLALEVKYPRLVNGAPVFTGDLLPSERAAYSLDPFALWTAFPPSLVARDSHDYYGSSATPRRQQRTVRLPRTQGGSAGTAGTLPTFTHQTGRQGRRPAVPRGHRRAHRNTPRGLARPISKRADETVLNDNEDRAPRQPIAASFGAAVQYRGFNHWFVSYAFLPCYRTRPAGGGPLLDRQGLLPPSASPPASDCPSASPDRYGGRGRGLSPRPVIWRLVAQCRVGRMGAATAIPRQPKLSCCFGNQRASPRTPDSRPHCLIRLQLGTDGAPISSVSPSSHTWSKPTAMATAFAPLAAELLALAARRPRVDVRRRC